MAQPLTALELSERGGRARWRDVSKEDRAKHAKMMVRARWKKARARKKARASG